MGRSSAGEMVALVTCPISRSPDRTGRAGRRRRAAVNREADELSRHAAVPAVQHANDDLLADVASFGQTDRPPSIPASSGIVSSSISR